MATKGQQRGLEANVRLLCLYEEDHSDAFDTTFRGVTLSKTSAGTWTVEDGDNVLDEFTKQQFESPRGWINHINGLAQHGEDYLEVVSDE